MRKLLVFAGLIIFVSALVAACGGGDSDSSPVSVTDRSLLTKNLVNEAAYIPSQCYTVTQEEAGGVYNPCYSCHENSITPNYINDSDLQESYDFPEYALKNNWINLFKDRSAQVASISDDEIMAYVKTDNYKNSEGGIILAEKLAEVPAEWDYDGDGKWDGYVPDCYFNFDTEGFDRAPDGSYTGWRAYGYAPFLGTFWPTNGSTDDVIIKLGDTFQRNSDGVFDLEVYKINLAVVEAMIKKQSVVIDPVDETKYNVDLDKDGTLGTASVVTYNWAPLESRYMYYVGEAYSLQNSGEIEIAAGLFPVGTEFLHSVRYIDITADDEIAIAPRMKELRYAKKRTWYSYSDLEMAAYEEVKEKHDFPDRLATFLGDIERGISNDEGWVYQGFIEDADGEMRPQTYEETVFCMGCHGGLGTTVDGVFTFGRKYDHSHFQKGWFHWSQKGLKGIPEHQIEYDGKGAKYEYSFYLEQNSAGDEFRGNEEVIAKFFNADGSLKADMLDALHDDISVLLLPSTQRAVTLNKAYRVIVSEQSFVYGRDASIVPSDNVYETIEPAGKVTGITDLISSDHGTLIFE
jgi:hypothetical protein